ncbi:MAG: hypothetical protein AABY22_12635 [Nanoarchaeota archaeon]
MEKAQKSVLKVLGISIAIIVILASIYISKGNPEDKNPLIPFNQTVLYYGITCPHCKVVEEFINDNNITSKININQKEAFENATNALELMSIGNLCKLNKGELGAVPLLFYNNTCYIGDSPIINFLNNTFLSGGNKI